MLLLNLDPVAECDLLSGMLCGATSSGGDGDRGLPIQQFTGGEEPIDRTGESTREGSAGPSLPTGDLAHVASGDRLAEDDGRPIGDNVEPLLQRPFGLSSTDLEVAKERVHGPDIDAECVISQAEFAFDSRTLAQPLDSPSETADPPPVAVTFEQILAEYVRKLRGEESQVAFARRVGISRSTISSVERGARSVNVGHVNQIAGALRMRPSQLLHALSDVAVELEMKAVRDATLPPWRPVGSSGQSFIAEDIAAKLPTTSPPRRGRPPKKR